MFKFTIALLVCMVMFTHGLPLKKIVEDAKPEEPAKEVEQPQPKEEGETTEFWLDFKFFH